MFSCELLVQQQAQSLVVLLHNPKCYKVFQRSILQEGLGILIPLETQNQYSFTKSLIHLSEAQALLNPDLDSWHKCIFVLVVLGSESHMQQALQ